MILERKGRNALIGVVAVHLGILVLIAGVIYGGLSGFRYEVKVVEGEMTVIPGLPFVIHLDDLVVEEYDPGNVAHLDPDFVPRKRQESHLSFYKLGEHWITTVAAPGTPATLDDITILPAFIDFGWVLELIVTDVLDREKTISIRPWSPPLINVGETPLMVHSLVDGEELKAQIFTKVDEEIELLGMIGPGQNITIHDHTITFAATKRYTGLTIYNRPHAPMLIAGCLVMLFGLVWHFYFRHRDRKKKE